MNQSELDIIKKLSAQASEPRLEFVQSLRKQLHNREQVLITNVLPTRRRFMNFKKLSVGLAGLVIIGAGTFVVANKLNSDEPTETAQTSESNSSTTQASSLPSQQAANLEEAKKSLSFTTLLPSKQLGGETLAEIKVGTKNNMLDDSDTIYLTYQDSQGALYKISQSSKSFNDPTDVEKVELLINGKTLAASFYQLSEVEESGPMSVGNALSPTSYMFWKVDGIRYEISEFGRVSKAQLIELASSLR